MVAISGQGTATGAYALRVTVVAGRLENPGAWSPQSGLGVISGWVCDAADLVIEIDGTPQAAAYGTSRADTAERCGDTDNGFGLLFNWNMLGDGEHTVVAVVDGVELGRATVTVTTLGEEFVQGAAGTCEVAGACRKSPMKSRRRVYIIPFYRTQNRPLLGQRTEGLSGGLKRGYVCYLSVSGICECERTAQAGRIIRGKRPDMLAKNR